MSTLYKPYPEKSSMITQLIHIVSMEQNCILDIITLLSFHHNTIEMEPVTPSESYCL